MRSIHGVVTVLSLMAAVSASASDMGEYFQKQFSTGSRPRPGAAPLARAGAVTTSRRAGAIRVASLVSTRELKVEKTQLKFGNVHSRRLPARNTIFPRRAVIFF